MSERILKGQRVGLKQPSASEAFQIATLANFFGIGDELDREFAERIQGSYRFLRPSRSDPKSKVNVGRLIIGRDAETTKIANGYSASYRCLDDTGYSRDQIHFEGVALPSKDFTLLVLNSSMNGDRLQVVFDRTKGGTNFSLADTSTQQLRGNLLYNIVNQFGSKPGGAYPVFASRATGFFPRFADVPFSQLRDKFGYDAWDRMRRGAVYERDVDFPHRPPINQLR
jgi:hypothetical protein